MNEITSRLHPFFKELGFRRKNNTWFYNNSNSFILCNYQKSAFSDSFYLNFGIAFKGLIEPTKIPSIHECHFWGRYGMILELERDSLNADENDIEQIIEDTKDKILPFLKQVSDFKFLLENFPDSFSYDKLWLQNITTNNFLKFLSK